MRALPCLFILLLVTNVSWGAEMVLPNGDFEKGMTGWIFAPGDDTKAKIADGGPLRGKYLDLDPSGDLLGVQTDRLEIGKGLKADTAYDVSALIKNEGVENGVFAFSMYCYDAAGKSSRQIAFYSPNPKSVKHQWVKKQSQLGPGTANPLPEGTASICLRFSFYEKDKDCRARVMVDDVELKEAKSAEPGGWPQEIVADVGDLQVRFESRSFWTLYRIDYRGTRLCKDLFGAHYGTVVQFPGIGFIGTGHTENENEELIAVSIEVDGKPVEMPASRYACQKIVLTRESKIHDLTFHTTVIVADNRIEEEVKMKALKETPVDLIYFFMHPWVPTVTEFLAETTSGEKVEGAFVNDKGMKVSKPTKWSAIYDGPTGKGAVTCNLKAPDESKWVTWYWDIPDVYRKHYIRAFPKMTVPANKEFEYKAVVIPFAAPQDNWKAAAEKLAATCK